MSDKEKMINQQIAQMLRILRTFNGVNQVTLGKALGITFQQVQKYEKGINRLSAARLFMICDYFHTTPEYFYAAIGSGELDIMKEYAGILANVRRLEALGKDALDPMIELLQGISRRSASNTA
jgi:transcriptional regulator with XRE-family HTH domain